MAHVSVRASAVAGLVVAGLLGTAPLASADPLVNVSDNDVRVNVCNNRLDANALGIQVPFENILDQVGLGFRNSAEAEISDRCT